MRAPFGAEEILAVAIGVKPAVGKDAGTTGERAAPCDVLAAASLPSSGLERRAEPRATRSVREVVAAGDAGGFQLGRTDERRVHRERRESAFHPRPVEEAAHREELL